MAELSDRTARAAGGPLRRRALLFLAAATMALSALATPWPAPGRVPRPAAQDCDTNFTIARSVSGVPAREPDTAMVRAGRKALQAVEDAVNATGCPVLTCPHRHTVEEPYLTDYGYVTGTGGVYYGYADAQGTYKCLP
jgi:hypothetical protein